MKLDVKITSASAPFWVGGVWFFQWCATQKITGVHSDSTAITRLAQLELSAKGETASDGVIDRTRSLTFSGKKPLSLIACVWDRGAYSEVVGGSQYIEIGEP